jgi:hypothetical protein
LYVKRPADTTRFAGRNGPWVGVRFRICRLGKLCGRRTITLDKAGEALSRRIDPPGKGERLTMHLNEEQQRLRERFVIALIEATFPLQEGAADREVTLELLIEAADLLKQHLQKELEELRGETD